MIQNVLLVFLISYFIGAIQFAFIFTKLLAKKNPGKEGSGNYGALNSYEITGKKTIGLLVFIFDCLKGFLAVYLVYKFVYPRSLYIIISAISVVLGHSFNIFLKFRGGRGLAASLGAVLFFNPFLALIWCIVWFLFYQIVKKDVIFSNMWSLLITPTIVIFAPAYIIYLFNYNINVSVTDYKIFSIIICVIILASHFKKSISQ